MQIHELGNFAGTPSNTDYLAIDNSTTTTKIGATGLGIQTQMTVAEATTGTSTSSRVITPKVLHDFAVHDVQLDGNSVVTSGVADIQSSDFLSAATIAKWDTILGI